MEVRWDIANHLKRLKNIRFAYPIARISLVLKLVMALAIGGLLAVVLNSWYYYFGLSLAEELVAIRLPFLVVGSLLILLGLVWLFLIKLRWDKKEIDRNVK